MAVYLLYDNKQFGPYEEAVVTEWLRTGRCSLVDLARRDGMNEWQPLHTFFPTPGVWQAGGGGALTSQHPTPPPARSNTLGLVVGILLTVVGGLGFLIGAMLTISIIGIVLGIPLLVISILVILLGVILIMRSSK